MPLDSDQPAAPFAAEFLLLLRQQLAPLRAMCRGVGLEFDELVQMVLVRMLDAQLAPGDCSPAEYQKRRLNYARRVGRNVLIDTYRYNRRFTTADFTLIASGALEPKAELGNQRAEHAIEELWNKVRQLTQHVPDPPPRLMVEEWLGLRQAGEEITPGVTAEWAKQFNKHYTTIMRWISHIEIVVEERVGDLFKGGAA